MNCQKHKIDSSIVGLRYAKEDCPGLLPTNPTWTQIEFNEMSKFSPELTYEKRTPITPSRQNQAGRVVDITSGVGFTQDVTVDNCTDLLQGFMFAKAREKATTKPLNGKKVKVSVEADGSLKLASAITVVANDLVLLEGFTIPANNGVFVVEEVTGAVIKLTTVLKPDVSVNGAVTKVGVKASCSFDVVDGLGELTIQNADKLGLIVGEWIFIGGSSATVSLDSNKGFARILEIQTGKLILDKLWSSASEAPSKLIEIYMGTVIKNEEDPNLIITQSYQFERTLGQVNGKTQAEYNIGAVANELKLTVPTSSKATVEMNYVSMRNEVRSGEDGLKDGDRPKLTTSSTMVNTSTDFHFINLSVLKANTVVPDSALFTYATDMDLSISNGVEPTKAIGVLGAFDTSSGNFDVTGSLTAYFTDVSIINSLLASKAVTLDFAIVIDGKACIYDVPLLNLGGGELTIEANQPIKIPVDLNASESYTGYTLMYVQFPFIPNI
ncbi:hypothetical protein [Vibrio phage vB_VibM_83AMN]|nr:hypothetical protein [Vibrio phage vB_VibM_83AMN]